MRSATALVLVGLLGCAGLTPEREMTGREFYDFLIDSRSNSAQSFRLVRETEANYYVEVRSSPFREKMLRVAKAQLHMSCAEGAQMPCVLKEERVDLEGHP